VNIIVTGADGYLGWPTALKLSRKFDQSRIIAVDNLARRKWVEEIGSDSAVELKSMAERIGTASKHGLQNISFIDADLADYKKTKDLVSIYNPEIVVHLAAQPSAPYSHISAEKAHYTQNNNIAMTRNLLWALREHGLAQTHLIETTTTGIYGAPSLNIPEGDIVALGTHGSKDSIPYPNMASSWYHVSKGFNATNMQLMNFQTKMPISDLRTSIIYGTDTEETRGTAEMSTRFDFDFFFGTLFNRWCAMAVIGEPLTLYGSGNQIKPFIHLEDAAQSIVNLVKKGNSENYCIYNQLTEYIRIKDLAEMIGKHMQNSGHPIEIKKIANPRVEEEETEYRFENRRFMELLSRAPKKMQESIGVSLDYLMPNRERIRKYRDRLLG